MYFMEKKENILLKIDKNLSQTFGLNLFEQGYNGTQSTQKS